MIKMSQVQLLPETLIQIALASVGAFILLNRGYSIMKNILAVILIACTLCAVNRYDIRLHIPEHIDLSEKENKSKLR